MKKRRELLCIKVCSVCSHLSFHTHFIRNRNEWQSWHIYRFSLLASFFFFSHFVSLTHAQKECVVCYCLLLTLNSSRKVCLALYLSSFFPHIHTHPTGDILVAPTTDPAWWVSLFLFLFSSSSSDSLYLRTPLFFRVKAVVVQHAGGVLSHASIVARELGLPCVQGVCVYVCVVV